jgi:hypothetical protein
MVCRVGRVYDALSKSPRGRLRKGTIMLTILSNIVALAYAGALDSAALTATCTVGHNTGDPVLAATLRAAHGATEAALTAALAPFGVGTSDIMEEGSYKSQGNVYNYKTDAATGARVQGTKMLAGADRR